MRRCGTWSDLVSDASRSGHDGEEERKEAKEKDLRGPQNNAYLVSGRLSQKRTHTINNVSLVGYKRSAAILTHAEIGAKPTV